VGATVPIAERQNVLVPETKGPGASEPPGSPAQKDRRLSIRNPIWPLGAIILRRAALERGAMNWNDTSPKVV